MNNGDEILRSDESLERLLGLAGPRPVPPVRDAELMRSAVHAEWRATIRKRRRTRQAATFAIAASILAAVGLAVNTLRVTDSELAPVASISRSFGSIYVLGEQSELRSADDLTALLPGQTVITDTNSGLALAWNDGGSLRLDADTRVTFTAANAIELRSGRVYLDSRPFGAMPTRADTATDRFEIHTDFGVISHDGTQYMVDTSGKILAVSVREGRVAVDGTHHDATAVAGQQLRIAGRSRPVTLDIASYGAQWAWVERTSPTADMDGRTLHDFLDWVSRESGLAVRFANPAAEQLARATELKGRVDSAPTQALTIWLQTTDLEARIEDGNIFIRKTDAETTR